MATEFSKGYVFHTTSPANALKILADRYLTPLFKILDVSFTRDPFLGGSVYFHGVTFVFLEKVIIEKYGGKEVEVGYEQEEEVYVTGRVVYIADCHEVLMQRDTVRKYGFGYKYPYKDIRYRLGTPWRAFRELAPQFPWKGPPEPRLFR